MIIPMFLGLGMPEVIVIMLVVLLLFGGKKVPELMKGLGKGIRSFKEGMNGLDNDEEQKKGTQKENVDDKQEQNSSRDDK
ncbi:MAG: twin-arginine translocase TatA/TatE family subunit [Bacteroidaceae bacterium]|nr:twin-arginine translocase TatA/TatE family subunit [Bacteroidaceae bacterium]